MTAPYAPRIIATFAETGTARRAAASAQRIRGVTSVLLDRNTDRLDLLVDKQHREMDLSLPSPSVGVLTGGQARGGLVWGLAGILVGALLVGPLALLIDAEGSTRVFLVLAFALAGALGVSSATFVFGGARQSEVEGETRSVVADHTVTVVLQHADPDIERSVGKALIEAGAVDVSTLAEPVARGADAEYETVAERGPLSGPASGTLMDDTDTTLHQGKEP